MTRNPNLNSLPFLFVLALLILVTDCRAVVCFSFVASSTRTAHCAADVVKRRPFLSLGLNLWVGTNPGWAGPSSRYFQESKLFGGSGRSVAEGESEVCGGGGRATEGMKRSGKDGMLRLGGGTHSKQQSIMCDGERVRGGVPFLRLPKHRGLNGLLNIGSNTCEIPACSQLGVQGCSNKGAHLNHWTL